MLLNEGKKLERNSCTGNVLSFLFFFFLLSHIFLFDLFFLYFVQCFSQWLLFLIFLSLYNFSIYLVFIFCFIPQKFYGHLILRLICHFSFFARIESKKNMNFLFYEKMAIVLKMFLVPFSFQFMTLTLAFDSYKGMSYSKLKSINCFWQCATYFLFNIRTMTF